MELTSQMRDWTLMGRWTIEGDYAADGAVCVRQAFTPDQVEWARDAIDNNLANLSPRAKRASVGVSVGSDRCARSMKNCVSC